MMERADARALAPGMLTAEKMLAWRRSLGTGYRAQPPEGVLLTHQGSLFRSLAAGFPPRRQKGLYAELAILPRTNGRVAVAGNFGIGGPATAVVIEELAAIGVERIIAVDLAASLSPEVRSGTVFLTSDAICADGTSPHYSAASGLIDVDPDLSARLAAALARREVPFTAGRVWSTDAVYRETAAEVQRYAAQGALVADMETAALLACGRALGVQAASALVVADTLFEEEWRPPPEPKRLQERLRRVAEAARDALLE
ncbi:MAG TPA: hypothetical protein VNN21_01855 [Dehalococcoidia bacterium]|nr:hypothetical protein [Dehalococcoidia bacterium]